MDWLYPHPVCQTALQTNKRQAPAHSSMATSDYTALWGT